MKAGGDVMQEEYLTEKTIEEYVEQEMMDQILKVIPPAVLEKIGTEVSEQIRRELSLSLKEAVSNQVNKRIKEIPRVQSKLRRHIVAMPKEILAASGILIWGHRIRSLVFTTDVAIIRNCNADAVLAVYPFTPQQVISDAIIQSSYIPVFAGVGGGTTQGMRTVTLAQDAEAQGAMGLVVNSPMSNENIALICEHVDIPVVVTVVGEQTDIGARLAGGASILNISAAAETPRVVASIRARYPELPIIATGGPTGESIRRTIEAGANAISYTPPTTKELFTSMMASYRSRGE